MKYFQTIKGWPEEDRLAFPFSFPIQKHRLGVSERI